MPKRVYGTGHLYEKSGAYYGRWRTLDGRQLNRKVGRIRRPRESDGLTRPQAERELSTDGKSDLSTRRSVLMADRLAGELDRWSQRTEYHGDGDLVFAHPQTG